MERWYPGRDVGCPCPPIFFVSIRKDKTKQFNFYPKNDVFHQNQDFFDNRKSIRSQNEFDEILNLHFLKAFKRFVCLCHINMSRDLIVTIFHRTGQLPFLRLEPFFDKIGNIHANEIV